jgi:hypothetical protein
LVIVSTSASFGTFLNVEVPDGKSAAASSGRAAFLAPLTGIFPTSRAPPSTTILSMDLQRNAVRDAAIRNDV